uniref:LD43057p n=1 Tax=Drosophila melanogaster TaxID=7227 RepID=Q8T006_DROME|nr:LD43057p [Drosophila melanogaster]
MDIMDIQAVESKLSDVTVTPIPRSQVQNFYNYQQQREQREQQPQIQISAIHHSRGSVGGGGGSNSSNAATDYSTSSGGKRERDRSSASDYSSSSSKQSSAAAANAAAAAAAVAALQYSPQFLQGPAGATPAAVEHDGHAGSRRRCGPLAGQHVLQQWWSAEFRCRRFLHLLWQQWPEHGPESELIAAKVPATLHLARGGDHPNFGQYHHAADLHGQPALSGPGQWADQVRPAAGRH